VLMTKVGIWDKFAAERGETKATSSAAAS
jgi:hypothetical protein